MDDVITDDSEVFTEIMAEADQPTTFPAPSIPRCPPDRWAQITFSRPSWAWFNSLNKHHKTSLVEWSKSCNINLVQVNGQRKYGGPPEGWVGEAPPFGTEIFINKIPQEIYEDKIIPLFQAAGILYEFRLMMAFSGFNRGFGFARYATVHGAELAISRFNGYEILPGCRIGVFRSVEKCNLELDGLPCVLDRVVLTRVLCEMTSNLEKVSLFASPTLETKNLAVLKYSSHRDAAMAKRVLCEVKGWLFICTKYEDTKGYTTARAEGPRFRRTEDQVSWLKKTHKRKISFQTFLEPHSSVPCMSLNKEPAPRGVECLRLICDQLGLAQPVYQIKFLRLGSCGWLRFWYQVAIPNYCDPFTGYAWLIGDKLIPTDKYEQAKEIVALRILAKLGEWYACK
ncbi:PREDICTED: dead end protein homolog 1 [Nanorana parkeri]|uniref:dead end protein homolog 1 n=1 Tax=Nanorana parkeri TaxID=125878 RepID=UPI000854ACA0|nr:PREDICTED: dead end protein homolog 1 [Nanorana parkeri]